MTYADSDRTFPDEWLAGFVTKQNSRNLGKKSTVDSQVVALERVTHDWLRSVRLGTSPAYGACIGDRMAGESTVTILDNN